MPTQNILDLLHKRPKSCFNLQGTVAVTSTIFLIHSMKFKACKSFDTLNFETTTFQTENFQVEVSLDKEVVDPSSKLSVLGFEIHELTMLISNLSLNCLKIH